MNKFFLSVFIAALLTGCSQKPVVRTEWLMGTVCTIKFYGCPETAVVDDCFDAIREIEQEISAVDPQSRLSAVNAGRQQTVSPLLGDLIAVSLKTAAETNGAFSPVLGRLTALWGFSGDAPQLPPDEDIARLLPAAVLQAVEYNPKLSLLTLTLPDSALDFGAIGKGYASDAVKQICKEAGCPALINLGGNIQTVDSKPDGKPWSISIQSPLITGTPTVGTLSFFGERSLSTSGDYQKFFYENGVKYHHILDPATGKPADSGLRSVTVVSQHRGAETDALSTALFVMGEKKGIEWQQRHPDIGVIWMTRDNRLILTANLTDAFTPAAESPFTVSILPLPSSDR